MEEEIELLIDEERYEEALHLLMMNEHDFMDRVDFLSKKVFVKEGLIKVEYDGEEYFLCEEKNILAVVEE